MSSLDVLFDVASQITDVLIDVQDFLLENYDVFKGHVVTVRCFGCDVVFDVDSIYNDFLKKSKKDIDK